jgi:hypothetical protein
MKNTPRGCLTAGGAKPPRVTPYISIQLVSVCKHSNWGYKGRVAPFFDNVPTAFFRGWWGAKAAAIGRSGGEIK